MFQALKKSIRAVKLLFRDGNYRSIVFMKIFHSKDVHQTASYTSMNRYPDIFSACRGYFAEKNGTDLNILSYGCSTGEEVLSLRHYFPQARLVGAEINKRNLEICRSLPVDENISFIYSSDPEIRKHGPYDAIFCMAVLQRKPHYIAEKGIRDLSDIYPFDKFEQQVIKLNQSVKPGGLLIIHIAQYSLDDTVVGTKYEPVGTFNYEKYGLPMFDQKSQLIVRAYPPKSIYRKKGG